jgi:hypothetical protein
MVNDVLKLFIYIVIFRGYSNIFIAIYCGEHLLITIMRS